EQQRYYSDLHLFLVQELPRSLYTRLLQQSVAAHTHRDSPLKLVCSCHQSHACYTLDCPNSLYLTALAVASVCVSDKQHHSVVLKLVTNLHYTHTRPDTMATLL
ncbi:hypothetical protein OTU49_014542, partial [Cherax quadricarinatus]